MNPEAEPKAAYIPREGVDYIIDFYAIADIDREIAQENIHRSINSRLMEYHPDRVSGTAEEFQATAERMTIMLNRARIILEDPQKREEYDDILGSWEGPISKNGTPMYDVRASQLRELQAKSSDELHAHIEQQTEGVAALLGYSPEIIPKLRNRLRKFKDINPDDPDIDELVRELLDAISLEDSMLADKEVMYREVLGLGQLSGSAGLPGPRYLELTQQQLEEAAEVQADKEVDRLQLEAGKIATRLLLLEHVDDSAQKMPEDPTTELIPRESIRQNLQQHIDKALEIGKARIELIEEIIENIPLIYPELEIQAKNTDKLIICIDWVDKDQEKLATLGLSKKTEDENGNRQSFHGFTISETSAKSLPIEPYQEAALKSENFRELIEQGYNIVVFENYYRIDPVYLLEAVINRHLDRNN